MEPEITDDNFGAWLLKCNPRAWDFEAFLRDGREEIRHWPVKKNARSALIKAGDPAAFWVSGPSEGALLEPGIWGVGTVTGSVVDASIAELEPEGGDYWIDRVTRAKGRHTVPCEIRLLPKPIPRTTLKSDPVLAGLDVIRQPQKPNPSWLTRSEWDALQSLLSPKRGIRLPWKPRLKKSKAQ